MRTRVSINLHGAELPDLDDRIILQSVEEPSPSWNIVMTTDGRRYGQRISEIEKRYRDIILRFAIKEHRDLEERESVIQAVRDWASAGGWMEVSYRPFERIGVRCIAMPAVNGITKSAEIYSITFRTCGSPEWEARDPDFITASGKTGTAKILIQPSMGGPLRLRAKNEGSTGCNTLQITTAGQTMRFENLGLAVGETFEIDYDINNRQIFRITGTDGTTRSALDKRTDGSQDDINLPQGKTDITYSAGAALAWRFYAHGRWAG